MLPLAISIAASSIVQSQHIDREKLDEACRDADRMFRTDPRPFLQNVESFLVYADDRIIYERYYGDRSADSLYHLQSQTKSLVSLLMVIAIDKGFLSGDHELVQTYYPEYFSQADSLKSRLTIRDLLTMSAGFDWEELVPPDDPANDNMAMYRSNNYLHYVLSKPVVVPPFVSFRYNSGCPMIVAGIIEQASRCPWNDLPRRISSGR